MPGATVRATSEIVGVHRNTATSFFMRLRRIIAGKLPSYELSGEVEADESYFGGTRKGKRGRGAEGKTIVLDGEDGSGCAWSRTPSHKLRMTDGRCCNETPDGPRLYNKPIMSIQAVRTV